MGIDASEVDHLIADLYNSPDRIQKSAQRTMKRSAVEIKKKMRKEFSGHSYAPKVPLSLEFEQLDGRGLAYEIGELDSGGPQWGIAAILAYGTSNNAPVADHRKALRQEAPVMLHHLGVDAERSVFGGLR